MIEPRLLTDTALIEANSDEYKKELDSLMNDGLSVLAKTYGTGLSQAIVMYTAHKLIESSIPVLPEDVVDDYKWVSAVTQYIAIGTFHNERQEGRV